MKQNFVFGMAVVALGLFTIVASAQPPQGRGGRGRPGGRSGGMMRGGMSIVQLLRSPAVQKEIKLTDEQKQKILAELESLLPQFNRKAMQDLSQEERRAKMREMMSKMRAQQDKIKGKLGEFLNEQQLKRLEQLRIQVMGPMALRSPEIATKLGLTDDQKKEMRTAMREAFTKMRDARSNAGGPPSVEEMKKMRATMQQAILGVLTDDQQAKYKELIGAPFDVSKVRSRSGFGGGRGGSARGGRRGSGRGRPGKRGGNNG